MRSISDCKPLFWHGFPYRVVALSPAIVAELFANLTPEEIEIGASVYYDGFSPTATAERQRVSRRTVFRALEAFKAALTRLDIPLPARPAVIGDSRHVRNIEPEWMRRL